MAAATYTTSANGTEEDWLTSCHVFDEIGHRRDCHHH